MINFTQPQITEIIENIVTDENGLNQILQISLEALMKSERSLHNASNGDSSNGFRTRRVFGHNSQIELRVPRTRNSSFYPVILALLKNQQEEAHQLAFDLYRKGLTTEQVGETFEIIYGKKYSTSQVSRMFADARQQVSEWQSRPLLEYYPIIYIDCVFIPTRRLDSVSKEAYYVVLAVLPDQTREVLGIYNTPTESSEQWKVIFSDLKSRGVKDVSLFVSDSLTGIEESIKYHFPDADIQLCVVHFKRSITSEVKPKHRSELNDDLRDVFYTQNPDDTVSRAKSRFASFCEKWAQFYPKIKDRLSSNRLGYYFTYYEYDYRMRNLIYTTNWIERLNRDFKRTTRMRGALPSPEATILLLVGVAIDKKNYLRKVPGLKNETKKFKWD